MLNLTSHAKYLHINYLSAFQCPHYKIGLSTLNGSCSSYIVLTCGCLIESKALNAVPYETQSHSGRQFCGGHDRSSSLENRLKQVCLPRGQMEAEREPGERSPGEACSQRSGIQVNEELLLCVFKDSALSSAHT